MLSNEEFMAFADAYAARRKNRTPEQQSFLETIPVATIEKLRAKAAELQRKKTVFQSATGIGVLGLGAAIIVDSPRTPGVTAAYLVASTFLLSKLYGKSNESPYSSAKFVADLLTPLTEAAHTQEMLKMAKAVPECDRYMQQLNTQKRELLLLDHLLLREIFFAKFQYVSGKSNRERI